MVCTCAPTSALVSCTIRPYSPGKALSSIRKRVWPASCWLAMSRWPLMTACSCFCIRPMLSSRRPGSSWAWAPMRLSSLPAAMLSATWVAWRRGRVMRLPMSQLSASTIRTTTPPLTVMMAVKTKACFCTSSM